MVDLDEDEETEDESNREKEHRKEATMDAMRGRKRKNASKKLDH